MPSNDVAEFGGWPRPPRWVWVAAGVAAVAVLAGVVIARTGPPAPRTQARSAPGVVGPALYIWPRGEPITYNDIACGGNTSCSSGLTGSVPAALRRPLHLPALVHGRCPTHRARVVEPHVGAAEGPGPIYPVIDDPAGRSGVLTFAYPPPPESYRAVNGFGGQRVLWLGAPTYQGPVLIRGGQLGGHNPLYFDSGTPFSCPSCNSHRNPRAAVQAAAGAAGRRVLIFGHPAATPGSSTAPHSLTVSCSGLS